MSVDMSMLSEAIDSLDINVIKRIRNLCEFRINKEKKITFRTKGFKLPGKQASCFRGFFSYGVEESIKDALSIPREISFSVNSLPWLLMQDWSEMFISQDHDKSKRYCVYQHHAPFSKDLDSIDYFTTNFGKIKSDTFYIGQGTITRPYDFSARDSRHKKMINIALSDCKGNKNEVVNVISKGLTKSQALELEAKLIFYFKPLYLVDGKLSNTHFPGSPSLLEGFELYPNGGIKDTQSNKKLLGEVLSKKIF